MFLARGARLNQYEVLDTLGEGGMGEVYKARDTRLQRHVAIKILPGAFARDADRVARFEREAHVLASLAHRADLRRRGKRRRAGAGHGAGRWQDAR